MKLGIITAEPENYVPVELKNSAEKLNIICKIIDVKKIVHIECFKDSKVFYDGEPLDIDVVIPRLNEYSLDIKLALLNRLEASGVKLLNTAASMALCNDKLQSQITLNEMGLTTPWSLVVHSSDELPNALKVAEIDNMKFPMILKTLRGTHGIGVMKVDSASSLVSVCQAMLAEDQQLMMQEFIEHKSSYRIIMIGHNLLAANERGQPADKDEFRTNSHLGSETKKYTPSEAELKFSVDIVDKFGCQFCAIDYIRLEDGRFVILEVNSSPGLEAIQKDWEGEKDLPEEVIKFVVSKFSDEPEAVAEPAELPPAPEVSELPPEPEQAPTLSSTTPVLISRIMTEPVEARVDSGAKLCSLHVQNIEIVDELVKFERDGIRYRAPLTRIAKIKSAHSQDISLRPIILLDITVAGKLLNRVEFSLLDRSTMKYEVLIGRNVLGMLGMPIHVPQEATPGEGEAQISADDQESIDSAEEE